jgi:phosphoglucosamine mutase
MSRLFGTDGVRGRAGEFPLDDGTVLKIGAATAEVLTDKLGRAPRFVSGRDTRESGPHIETLFHKGASSKGAIGDSAGVITTPGVAYLTGEFRFDVGVVISASHNPYFDNGIKLFLPSGQKLPRSDEEAIESLVGNRHEIVGSVPESVDLNENSSFARSYIEHLVSKFLDLDLSGRKIVIDCANGAASNIAPELFHGFGGELLVINASPDGRNINQNCGSLHLDKLHAKVVETNADFGVAFDGDADRSLFANEKGEVVDGDATLWILANAMLESGELSSGKVVATVMSNIGLETAFRDKDIDLVRTPVGDKYVLDELLKGGSEIGGEQSGHIIIPKNGLVGDGLVTALSVLKVLANSNKKFSELTNGFRTSPQVLVNVKVKRKRPFEEVAEIATAAAELEKDLADNGRLLLRYSGTENLARVMIEGADQDDINQKAHRLAAVIERALG